MAIQHGKKILTGHDYSNVLMLALLDAVGPHEIKCDGMWLVLIVGPAKYLIEDAKTEWRLCPLLELYWPRRIDTKNTIPIPKPST